MHLKRVTQHTFILVFVPRSLPQFDPRTVQPVASRYTDWATGPQKGQIYVVNIMLLHYCTQLNALLTEISVSQVRCDGGRQVSVRSANRWSTVSCIIEFTELQSIFFTSFQTFVLFWVLYAFFWVIPRRMNFICRRFETLRSVFIGK
jgi:hypothetical protein